MEETWNVRKFIKKRLVFVETESVFFGFEKRKKSRKISEKRGFELEMEIKKRIKINSFVLKKHE